jgi:hypothetical protein
MTLIPPIRLPTRRLQPMASPKSPRRRKRSSLPLRRRERRLRRRRGTRKRRRRGRNRRGRKERGRRR